MIPPEVLSAVFAAGLGLLGWSLKWNVDRIVTELQTISKMLGTTIERVVKLEIKESEREKAINERHEDNRKLLSSMQTTIRELQKRRRR